MKKFLITSAVALLLIAISRWASHNQMFTVSAACTLAVLALVIYMAVLADKHETSCKKNL